MARLHHTVKIVAHSMPPAGGEELISILMTYPRFIHPQMLRHRTFAHTAQSSRAVSFKKTFEWLQKNGPVIPIFTSDQIGMQEGESLEPSQLKSAENTWASTYQNSLASAWQLSKENQVHHSICNRLLEPFLPIAHLMTGSRPAWDYLLGLRLHQAADVHALELAREIRNQIDGSEPNKINFHTPFDIEVIAAFGLHNRKPQDADYASISNDMITGSIARCARISYLNYDKQGSIEKERAFVSKLWADQHASPFEHIAIWREEPAETGSLLGRDWLAFRHFQPEMLKPFFDHINPNI